ncbi:hypothetical protein SAMN06265222_118106 [Neorhodopirellula lusitana]|uniref:Uncharacterized protein n=1 Tax=Neorhodopirellula lusitana TaxID=445327 RepID=A0ABY1QPB9_9BACT|nr:hypothetical protein [Neorhodopirellula lusitana]SMP75014.1 hypothetical protein SAMN06265222_118106 [Neorhodopirellula lusitana]
MTLKPSFALLMLACALTLGCGSVASPPTLVVHVHDGVYDFINHSGAIVATAESLERFDETLRKPEIQNLIHDNRAVVRFAGAETEDGLDIPDDVNVAIAHLAFAGATSQEFDYTND